MAKASESTVIDLQSHPVWRAAQRRERQLLEDMRRHPAYQGRLRAAAMGGDHALGARNLGAATSPDAPA
ncbi:hypothetical protein H7H78_04565 [Mycobacterium shinjukuense]|uniref:Uncharacterized protein n=1 Tax=Mycobacterium shinjukuense TaxID=398694 RepID=A0A7I7MPY0_9MYCO|nr:hypothetical protein [Mycobacterium shinjukuense]MCV6984737.1 hypothetical protein [Mycobacterium shinjukuense]ORB67452.1 hypothetical protein BST45_12430 [Mycobacterium shinjukuense]BBX73369.1 hypothetical protein MSHI_12750 [Mycobacterium shinjukuense]